MNLKKPSSEENRQNYANTAGYTGYDYNQYDPKLETIARDIEKLGVVSVIVSVVGFFYLSILGLIPGIMGLRKYKKLKPVLQQLTPQTTIHFLKGKKLCTAGVVISILAFLFVVAINV